MNIFWLYVLDASLAVLSRRVSVLPHRDVQTTQGRVRGYMVQNDVYAYLGIPYAWISTHETFKAPKPPRHWDSIFEATHHIKCPQRGSSGDENCLVINVFTPAEGTSMPVLAYVHGGNFQSGWSPTEPIKLLLQKKIIVVTFNYRVGPLGFLCLREPEVPGNVGLKDQVAAFYWIQRNIANFGGNAIDVTAYGLESGAISIQLLILSGLTKGLFQKAILEDGSILSPGSMVYDPIGLAFKSARNLGYNGEENGKKLAAFFLKLTLKKLINITEHFLPCLEIESYYSHSLIDSDPYEVLQKGDFQNVPMIMMYADKSFEENILDTVPNNFEDFLPSNLEFPDERIKSKIADLVRSFYFSEIDYKGSFENYMKDVLVDFPTVKMASMFANKNSQPVFLVKKLLERDSAECKRGVCVNNISSLLYEAVDGKEWIQQKILTLLSNFIKLGDPTPILTAATPIICQPIKPSYNGRIGITPQLVINREMKIENAATQKILFWNHIYKFYKIHKIDYNIRNYEETTKDSSDELPRGAKLAGEAEYTPSYV